MSTSGEDIWGSDSDEGTASNRDEEPIEIKKLRYRHSKRGYLDGLSHSKEHNLQTGFDDSFPEGSKLGSRVGRILGTLQILKICHGYNDEKLRDDFVNAQKELKINRVLNDTNFDENYQLIDNQHLIVNKWEAIMTEYEKNTFD